MSDTRWLTPRAAAEHIGSSIEFIWQECRAGRLRHVRLAGRRDIRTCVEWLDASMMAYARGGTAATDDERSMKGAGL